MTKIPSTELNRVTNFLRKNQERLENDLSEYSDEIPFKWKLAINRDLQAIKDIRLRYKDGEEKE